MEIHIYFGEFGGWCDAFIRWHECMAGPRRHLDHIRHHGLGRCPRHCGLYGLYGSVWSGLGRASSVAHHGCFAEQYVVQVLGGLACRYPPLLLESGSGAIFGDGFYRGDPDVGHCLILISIRH